MEIKIRPADTADATEIARLHLRAWRQAYRGLATAEAFAVMDEEFRARRWQATLSTPGLHQRVLLAEHAGRLVGIGVSGAPSLPIFGDRGEIRSLYIDPDYARRGIGRLLLRHLAAHLAQHGYGGAALGVVVGNDGAIAFYQSLGGRAAGQYLDPGPIWRSQNIAFVWDDLTPLIGSG